MMHQPHSLGSLRRATVAPQRTLVPGRFGRAGRAPRQGDLLVPRGTGMSLFTPFTGLPAEGEMMAYKDEMCNPNTSNCKTVAYTYETKCKPCYGTGYVRARAARGSRGMAPLIMCLCCHGLGFVRHTTANLPTNGATAATPARAPGQDAFGSSSSDVEAAEGFDEAAERAWGPPQRRVSTAAAPVSANPKDGIFTLARWNIWGTSSGGSASPVRSKPRPAAPKLRHASTYIKDRLMSKPGMSIASGSSDDGDTLPEVKPGMSDDASGSSDEANSLLGGKPAARRPGAQNNAVRAPSGVQSKPTPAGKR